MATHYETLGVSRSASDDEIKKAFRKLTRQYHPDVSKDQDAPIKMAEINAAYDVLKDPEKRQAYDYELDHPQPDMSQFTRQRGGQTDFDFNQFNFRDAGGTGFGGGGFASGGFNFEDLFGNGGMGGFGGGRSRQTGPQRGEDQHAVLTIDLHAAYEGATRQLALQVPQVDAQGHMTLQNKTLNVKIPKGIKAGQSIRLAGQGLPGRQGGPSGDLLLEIQFENDARYQVSERDVTMSLPVAPWEAMLGATVAVDTPGGTVEVKVPADSQAGRKLRLSGRGIPGSGNQAAGHLYLVLQVVLPPADRPEARQLYEQMRDQLAFNPRQGR